MKRYLLFAGYTFPPFSNLGGWRNYQGDFACVVEAATHGGKLRGLDWWHVVDTTTKEIVAKKLDVAKEARIVVPDDCGGCPIVP